MSGRRNPSLKQRFSQDDEIRLKKRIRDVERKLQESDRRLPQQKDCPPIKRSHGLKIREEEFEKTPSKKIKRYQSELSRRLRYCLGVTFLYFLKALTK